MIKNKNKYSLSMSLDEEVPIEFASINQPVVFKSSKGDVAYVDENGVIKANRLGKVKLTTKINNKTIMITVTVR